MDDERACSRILHTGRHIKCKSVFNQKYGHVTAGWHHQKCKALPPLPKVVEPLLISQAFYRKGLPILKQRQETTIYLLLLVMPCMCSEHDGSNIANNFHCSCKNNKFTFSFYNFNRKTPENAHTDYCFCGSLFCPLRFLSTLK